MADDGDKLLSIPGVLEGSVKPDYDKMIKTATEEALRKMLFPSILALVIPVVGGLLFGVEFIGGLLVGATIVAIPRAIFMGNSGGAFDNAKKFIDFLNTVECQKNIPLTQWMFPSSKEIELPESYISGAPVPETTLEYNPQSVAEAVPVIMEILAE